ncbi:MAG: AgmX/PglI C-terminal domain-containing protein [Deltaproteobacteria bacterium]|nr:AgmX/PglI C-terminal domain-containing protein [Deltaproteobacteria bacterium]
MRRSLPTVVVTAFVFLATAAAAPAPEPVIGGAGTLPKEAIVKVIKAAAAKVRACHDARRKALGAELTGKLVLRFTIGPEGLVTAAAADKGASSIDDAELVQCVTKVARAWKFDKPLGGGVVEVTYPFIFAAASREKTKEADDDFGTLGFVGGDAKAERGSGGGGGAVGRGVAATSAPPPPAPSTPSTPAAEPAPGRKPDVRTKSRPHETEEAAAVADRAPMDSPKKDAAAPASRPAEHKGSSGARSGGAAGGRKAVAAPAMRAGRYDDNKQYNRFLGFLADNSRLVVYPVNVSERLLITALDKNGKSLPNCTIDVKTVDGKVLATSTTTADGSTQYFPADAAPKGPADFTVGASCGATTRNGQASRTGKRVTELRFDTVREIPARVPVDVAFLLDTTGSMQSQIDRLKTTLQAIHFQLTELPTKPDIRFGLVAYRDRGDDYVTRVTQFTADVDLFQSQINKLDADGGGDTPEDMQAAFDKGMHELQWRKDAVRVGFVISDAIPHTDYKQDYSYREAMREALRRGIKWVMVGAGGLPIDGEVIFRQVAQFTMGEYVFVTEGGGGDSGGTATEASHHVGSNYLVENLDQAIIRIIRRELSYLTDEPKEVDDTIIATGPSGTPKDELLGPAVAEALRQLVDYSAIRLKEGTAVAIVPVNVNDAKYKDVGGYLSDQFILAASRTPTFKVVDRDLKALAQEQRLQLSELFDVKESVPIGKLLGAEVLVVAKLTVRGTEADLFAKLLSVETGEVLSVAKVRVTGGVI